MSEPFTLRPPAVPPRDWIGGAEFSPCRTWRYRLWRHEPGCEFDPYVVYIALNPSIASETVLDPTITREIGFAQSWGFRRIFKGNLFALVSTDPKGLYRAPDPVGPSNSAALESMIRPASKVVCAWGQERIARTQAAWFMHWCRELEIELWCFGTNDDGSPKHPLYLKATTPLERYRGAA